MTRIAPYRTVKGGGYVARSGRYSCGAIRPTRGAAGMTFTASRGGGTVNSGNPMHAATVLRMWGTLDPLRKRMNGLVERGVCPCCGGPGKLQLSDHGRKRLAALRTARATR